MVTIDILLSFIIVLATVASGAYALGYTIGKLSSKKNNRPSYQLNGYFKCN